MKRIGIDLHVVDGKYQGSRTHVLEIYSRVIKYCPDIQFYLFLENTEILQKYSSAYNGENVELVKMEHCNPIKRLMYKLPLLQKNLNLDLLHTQYIIPFPSLSPCVVTIHDVLFEEYPEYFSKMFSFRSKLLMRYSAKKAKHVFTVSEYSKRALQEQYKIDKNNITVIDNAIDNKRFFPGLEGTSYLKKRGLNSGEYLLTVGRLEPRKNHMGLIDAYAKVTHLAPKLVIIGQKDFGYESILQAKNVSFLKGKVIFIENADDIEIAAFYRHARLFIYPSFAEGFGMPPLEAMASGTPVIVSNTTAIPEVVGDAGLLIDPHDSGMIAEAITQLLSDDEKCAALREKGLERAKAYSWDKSAKIVSQFYKKFLN